LIEGDLAQLNVSVVQVFSQNVAKNALHVDRVLYSPPCLTTGIQWIWWILVDFWWIQQDYIVVIKRLQIYPVDLVDSWWIVVDLWWICGGLLVSGFSIIVDC